MNYFTESNFVLNQTTNKINDLNHPQLKELYNYQDDGFNFKYWLIEGSHNINPNEFNDNATTKYEGYIIKRIPRTQFKNYIRYTFNDLIYEGVVDTQFNNDCLDNRYKYNEKLSLEKLVNKVWNNERFNFLNDGFFTTKRYVYIISFNYSTFDSNIQNFN